MKVIFPKLNQTKRKWDSLCWHLLISSTFFYELARHIWHINATQSENHSSLQSIEPISGGRRDSLLLETFRRNRRDNKPMYLGNSASSLWDTSCNKIQSDPSIHISSRISVEQPTAPGKKQRINLANVNNDNFPLKHTLLMDYPGVSKFLLYYSINHSGKIGCFVSLLCTIHWQKILWVTAKHHFKVSITILSKHSQHLFWVHEFWFSWSLSTELPFDTTQPTKRKHMSFLQSTNKHFNWPVPQALCHKSGLPVLWAFCSQQLILAH